MNFEASGGLLHASLVMQDKETDSYWAIMEGVSLAGEMKGRRLEELPLGEKAQWKDWRSRYPETLVLSVEGVEHIENNPYDNYFQDEKGFRGLEAEDDRLPTKTSIYAFQRGGKAYAVPFGAFEGGAAFALKGEGEIFLFRAEGVPIFDSTAAFVSSAGFAKKDGVWIEEAGGARFDPQTESFVGGLVERLHGFDTFWVNWSLNNPNTAVLATAGG